MYGNNISDPASHSSEHIAGFADYIGQLAIADLQASSSWPTDYLRRRAIDHRSPGPH